MKVAFFADDASATAAAILVNHALRASGKQAAALILGDWQTTPMDTSSRIRTDWCLAGTVIAAEMASLSARNAFISALFGQCRKG
jgi:hypothetical protein